jgi:serine/threonine-protein kinase
MSSAQLAHGSIFAGRYVVDKLLGAGGMGSVFAAQHTSTGRKVAIKLMLPTLVAEPGMRERFAQEARVSSLIQSKHVVEVLDAGVDVATGSPFLAMELLEGRDFGQLLRERRRLPADEVVRLLSQVARGLDRAHAAGVVHRDLKPENLFLCTDEDGSPLVKILDFGLAKLLQGQSGAATLSAGTPTYMAPEQLGMAPITPAADVWAFGLIAFTLLTGSTYWEVDSIAQLYGALMAPTFPPPLERARALGVMLPPPFEAWFSRCTARDLSHRFASAGEACEQLRLSLGALGVAPVTGTHGSLAAPPPPPPPPYASPPTTNAGYAIPPTHVPGGAPLAGWGPPPAAWGPGYAQQPQQPQAPMPHAMVRPANTGGAGVVVAIVAIVLGVVAIGGIGAFVALRGASTSESNVASKDDDEKKPAKSKKSQPRSDDERAEREERAARPARKKKPTGEIVDAPAEHLKATFPASYPEPKHSTQPLPAVPGVDLVMWTSETLRGACLVGYIDYKSKSVFAGRTTKMAFDGARDGALANMGAKLEDERDFEYQGFPARVFTFEGFTMGKQIYGRQLLILEGYHLYQVMFIGYTKTERDEEDIVAFFDAIEISP